MSVRAKQVVNGTILLAGLVLCIVALLRLQQQHPLRWSPNPPGLIAFFSLAIGALAMMGCAWQRYVLAFFGVRLPARDAAYQSCLMLVAKYVPVMIAGFVARISAYAAHVPAKRVVFATLTELAGAVAAATVVGLLCLASVLVPAAVPLVVAFAAAGIWLAPTLVKWTLRVVSRRRPASNAAVEFSVNYGTRRALREASVFQVLQWVLLGGFVASSVKLVAPEMEWSSLVAISGAYALAVVVGIAVIFLPGGIGAREAAFVWLASAKLDSGQALQLALALRVAMSVLDLIAGTSCIVLRIAFRKDSNAD